MCVRRVIVFLYVSLCAIVYLCVFVVFVFVSVCSCVCVGVCVSVWQCVFESLRERVSFRSGLFV